MLLTVNEVKTLEFELFGQTTTDGEGKLVTLSKGLFSYPLSFKCKYWLQSHLIPKLKVASDEIHNKTIELAEKAGCVIVNSMDKKYVDMSKSTEEARAAYIDSINEFANSESNSIEIDFEIPLSYFEGLDQIDAADTLSVLFKFVNSSK